MRKLRPSKVKELCPRSCKLEQANLDLKPISVCVPSPCSLPPYSRLLKSRCLQDAWHVADALLMILNWGLGPFSQFCKGRGKAEPRGGGARVGAVEEGREPVW